MSGTGPRFTRSERIASFLDSNVLIYGATAKQSDPRKFQIAVELIDQEIFGISGQTLAEFASVTLKKKLLEETEVNEWLDLLSELPLVPIDATIVHAGLAIARRYGTSYYDGALLAAAERLGATTFYTEDLNHNQLYGSVRAVNPFLEH